MPQPHLVKAWPESGLGKKFVHCILDGEQVGRFLYHHVDIGTITGRMSRAHDHRSFWRTGLDDLCHLGATHAGHGIVCQHQAMDGRIEAGESLSRRIGGINLITEVIEEHLGQ